MKKSFGIIAIVIIIAGIAGGLVLQNKVSKVAENQVKKYIKQLEPFADISYKSLKTSIISRSVKMSGIEIAAKGDKTKKIDIDEVIVSNLKLKNNIPVASKVEINGINIDLSEINKKSASKLKELGYGKNLKLNYLVDSDFDIDKGVAVMKSVVSIDDMGKIAFDFNIGGLFLDMAKIEELRNNTLDSNKDSKNVDPDMFFKIFTKGHDYKEIVLNNVELSYIDNSLMDRLYKNSAKSANVDVKTFKKMMTGMIQMSLAKLDKKQVQLVVDFVKDPKKISLSANPEKPLSISDIMGLKGPDDIAEKLNLKIKL